MEIYQRGDWPGLTAHEAADVFPLMTESELGQMVEDMRARGFDQRYPVALIAGQILDGRNRLAACRAAGVEPWFVDYTGDEPTAFVVRANLQRRQLTRGQAAVAAAKLLPLFALERRAKQSEAGGDRKSESAKSLCQNSDKAISKGHGKAGRATVDAGAALGVGRSMVERAARLQREAPDLFREVEEGKRTVNRAVELMKRRTGMTEGAVKPKQARKAKHPREETLAGFEAIIEGKMEAYLDVAYALLEIRERRLFLDQHGEFKRYLKERWGVSFQRFMTVMAGIDAVVLIGEAER